MDDVSLDIAPGEFVTLLGPSGSGKTTTLMMLAGFEIPSAGEIWVDDRSDCGDSAVQAEYRHGLPELRPVPAYDRWREHRVSAQMRGMRKSEIRGADEGASGAGWLPGYEGRYPRQLSGGQQQRIAVARALVFNPRVLLMDEPLGALDKQLRERLQLEIKALHEQLGVTIIYVTHDQQEALVMSDRIAVMNEGRIEQFGSPTELYDEPADEVRRFDFIGESNFIDGTHRAAGRQRRL